jgi:hypothetical protein
MNLILDLAVDLAATDGFDPKEEQSTAIECWNW